MGGFPAEDGRPAHPSALDAAPAGPAALGGGSALDHAFAEAARILSGAREVVVLGHMQPDADALGSALALGAALHRRGARVTVSHGAREWGERPPRSLAALDELGLLVEPAAVPPAPEVVVACDTADRSRLGLLADRLDTAGASVLIDHHASNPGFGDHRLLDPAASATAELVHRLLGVLGLPIDPVVGRCLYAGLVTDTVGFRIGGPVPLRIAADLVAAGVEPEPLLRRLTDSHPFAWLAALGDILREARLEPDRAGGAGLAHATVPADVVSAFGAEEVESVVTHVRTAVEAEVTAVLKQVGERVWSVSLRARGGVDVSAVAVALGGGGHRNAAGYTTTGTRDEVLDRLRAELDGAVTPQRRPT